MERWWLLAPGAIYLLAGTLFLVFPPASPHTWYGFHTRSSERDQASWNDANRFAGWGLLLIGVLSCNTAITCIMLHAGHLKAWLIVFAATAGLSIVCVIATKAWLQAREDGAATDTEPPDRSDTRNPV